MYIKIESKAGVGYVEVANDVGDFLLNLYEGELFREDVIVEQFEIDCLC